MWLTHGWPEGFALVGCGVAAYKTVIEQQRGLALGNIQTVFRKTPRRPWKGNIMNVARSFSTWRKYRQTVNELGRMTTRELNDLGIARSDIRTVARSAAAL